MVANSGLLLYLALGIGACLRASSLGLIGPQPDGTEITPNHWLLTPAGRQVEVGDRPLGLAATPDGRYLLITNNGQGVQSLVFFDTQTEQVVQTLPYESPEALCLGLVVAPDGVGGPTPRRKGTTSFGSMTSTATG
jgi:hypothetical protein